MFAKSWPNLVSEYLAWPEVSLIFFTKIEKANVYLNGNDEIEQFPNEHIGLQCKAPQNHQTPNQNKNTANTTSNNFALVRSSGLLIGNLLRSWPTVGCLSEGLASRLPAPHQIQENM